MQLKFIIFFQLRPINAFVRVKSKFSCEKQLYFTIWMMRRQHEIPLRRRQLEQRISCVTEAIKFKEELTLFDTQHTTKDKSVFEWWPLHSFLVLSSLCFNRLYLPECLLLFYTTMHKKNRASTGTPYTTRGNALLMNPALDGAAVTAELDMWDAFPCVPPAAYLRVLWERSLKRQRNHLWIQREGASANESLAFRDLAFRLLLLQ